ncbi:radical SAM family heme chaperone HemW [Croceicoccus sp. YJ47]|uniref:radical SAM family heme chaperone HemW n=1 Tax=Croceicoccus sp. YJ47 TaxID=2798724 RepID=UPI001924E4EE|nr:radical SAM family heme chaperone HemW [Croceicoccus sp. YJ47]QQN74198.1 coproporphyrinogen III oxidase [Croceicoccus sp. YJ47]
MTLALYIHWPFCAKKCPYCDFNSHVRDTVDVAAWEAALLADMAFEAERTGQRTLTSIFFGGGTPSLMPPELVERLIAAAGRHWSFAEDVEITLEANPSSVEASRFADLARAGINRTSLGLQSLDDKALKFLGRLHGAAEGLAALDTAQAHFKRVSFDLIYALPGQTEEEWQAMLSRALGFGTGHLSLYQLTIEPGTRFATDLRQGAFAMPEEDLSAEMFAMTRAMTAAAGLPAYEVSNHARPGGESRHNLTYWRYGDYAGIGPGAHGLRCATATQRHRKPENFLTAVRRDGHGICDSHPLPTGEQAAEALMMGLRLDEGVDLDRLSARFGMPMDGLVAMRQVALYRDLGFVTLDGSRLTVTPRGMVLLDGLLGELVQPELLLS